MPDPAGWLVLSLAAIVGSTIGGVAGFGTGVGRRMLLWPDG